MFQLLRKLLIPFTLIYGGVMAMRNMCYRIGIIKSYSFDIPVISVGNLTVGGTGKTPHIEFLIHVLQKQKRIAVLSRGYARKTKGFKYVLPTNDATQVGDEPLQIKQKYTDIIVAVDEDRVHGIKKLLSREDPPEIVLLDDAFQHRRVKPGLQILLDNFHHPIHSDIVLPAGNLREFRAGSKRADIVIVTKCDGITNIEVEEFKNRYSDSHYGNLFFSNFSYNPPVSVFKEGDVALNLQLLKKAHVLVVTGISNPTAFEKYLALHSENITTLRFSDHHTFTQADESSIIKSFNNIKHTNKYLITTEKDAMRFSSLPTIKEQISDRCFYIPVRVNILFNAEEDFTQKIIDYVQKI